MRARLLGTGAFVPAPVVDNAPFAARLGVDPAWIEERSGIRTRHFAPADLNTSDMAAAAGRNALVRAGLDASQLDLVLVTTITADEPMPATACHVQRKLGAGRCAAFDISAAFAGFIYALATVDAFIASGRAKHALVIGADLFSRFLDFDDRDTSILFGDGAGAAVFGPADGDGAGLLSTALFADGSKASMLSLPGGGSALPPDADTVAARLHHLRMEGGHLFRVAVRALTEGSQAALAQAELGIDAVQRFIPHQANLRIINAVAKRLGLGCDRIETNLERLGNTGSASIPIALHEAIEAGRTGPGDRVLLSGVGAGLTWGSALLQL